MTLRLVIVATALATAPFCASAQTPADSAGTVARGRTLFEGKGLCFSCHGKGGEGALGPTTRLAGRRLVHTKASISEISTLIRTGVDSAHSTSGQVMPARGGSRLSDDEVLAVAAYVIELQKTVRLDDK